MYQFSCGRLGTASPLVLLKSALFTVFIPRLVAWVIPQRFARRESPELPINRRLSKWTGWSSLIGGFGLYLHTVWRFADEGLVTPEPWNEPEELVVGGMYAHVRNPMYVGLILVVVGKALIHRSPHVLWWAVG